MTAALEIKGLQAWYGESHVLHGVDMVVQPGEVVTLLGRNGAGRTTTMRAILGLTGARKGSIKVNGNETIHLPTHRIAPNIDQERAYVAASLESGGDVAHSESLAWVPAEHGRNFDGDPFYTDGNAVLIWLR